MREQRSHYAADSGTSTTDDRTAFAARNARGQLIRLTNQSGCADSEARTESDECAHKSGLAAPPSARAIALDFEDVLFADGG